MARKSFYTLFVLLSLLFTVSGAFADSYQNARQAGTFTTDTDTKKNFVNVSINVSKTVTTGYPTNFTGSIYIIGVTGQIATSISCQPKDLQFTTVKIGSGTYKQATVTSKPFIYVDLRTGRRTQAWAVVTMTQYGYGKINYNVYSLDDDSGVAGSILASGTIGDIDLTKGSTIITP